MKSSITFLITTVLLLSVSISINGQNETDFYTEKNHLVSTTKSILDFGAIANDVSDDSQALQNAIDDASSQPNGGKVTIPAGTFYLKKIYLKSNVHIEIDKNAIIKIAPWEDLSQLKNYSLFFLTVKNALIENVSIRCSQVGEKYTIDFRNLDNPNIRAFQLNNVDNFYVGDFYVIDDNTKFSAVTFGTEDYSPSAVGWNAPKNGIIKNGDIVSAHYGYGLVQAQAATNVLFKNLSGQGGVTLRFETGYDKMNEEQIGGLFNCYGRNISCTDGNAAYMMSPHAIQNGHVDIQGINAVNCGFACRIGKGYVKKDQEGIEGVFPGTFSESSIIKDVIATYGESAQVKSKHFKYLPCSLRHLISKDYNIDGESYSAPAICPILNTAYGNGEGYFDVNISNVSSNDFTELSNDILHETDAVVDCNVASVPDITSNGLVKVYPNPFKDKINLSFHSNHDYKRIELMSINGSKLVGRKIKPGQTALNIKVAHLNLPKGYYVLALYNKQLTSKQKVLKL